MEKAGTVMAITKYLSWLFSFLYSRLLLPLVFPGGIDMKSFSMIREKLFLCIVCKEKYQNLLRNEWSVLANPSPLHQPGRDDAMTWPVCFVLLSCQVMTQYDMKCHNMAFVCQHFYLPFAAKAPGLWQEIQSMAEVPGKEIIWHLHH